MANFSIVDTHLHLWDLQNLRYPWLDEEPKINKNFLLEDYKEASKNLDIQQMVFMQCDCLPEQSVDEAMWVAGLMQEESRLAGMVARAPLEGGEAIAKAHLDQLHAVNPKIKGIRRLLQGEPSLDFCLQPSFIEGVKVVGNYNLPFDLCLNYRHLPNALEFAKQVPQVKMVIDHIAKPDIKAGTDSEAFQQWKSYMAEFAKLDHVHCKLSSMATEANHENWTIEDLRPYVNHVIEHFGAEKCFFASDMPVSTLASSLEKSVNTLAELISDLSDDEKQAIFSKNGKAFYGI